MKRLFALTVAGLALAAVTVSAPAQAAGNRFATTAAFLCYSKFQTDPGVWSIAPTKGTSHDTAADLLTQGYWSPFAETSVPTKTRISGGYYLDCNPPAALAPVVGVLRKYDSTPRPELVTQKGSLIEMSPKYVGEPGLYPLVAA